MRLAQLLAASQGKLETCVLLVGAGAACSSEERPAADGNAAAATVSSSAGDLLFAAPPQKDVAPWLEDTLRAREAGEDGWRTEILAELAKPVLSGFLDHLLDGASARAAFPLAPGFRASDLRPVELEQVFERGGTVARRGASGPPRHARDELPRLVRDLLTPFGEGVRPEHHLKIVDVVEGESTDTFAAIALVHFDARASRSVQQNLEVRTVWRVLGADEGASLRSIEVLDFEEVVMPGPLFAEVTAHVFGDVPRFRDEFLRGIPDYWFRTDILFGHPMMGMQGIAVGDVDGDALEDVFVPQQGGLPNRLFLRREDGKVRDVSRRSGLDFLDGTRSALILDFDNDGDQDVALSVGSVALVAYNDGTARFLELVANRLREKADVYTMCAADPDLDGDLDLYCCRWSYNRVGEALNDPPLPFHDANNGPPNVFWRQDGPRSFTDATEEVGLNQNNTRFSYAAIWEDLDDDGSIDLYVANDFGRNNLFRNEGGRFRDVALEAGAEDKSSGMGVTVADYDLDGDKDLYVTNMFSSAGRRIVPQYRYRNEGNEDLLDSHYRFARGNTLLANRGDGTFDDVTESARVAVGGWGWGSKFLDVDNDGFEDLYCPNGYFTGVQKEDL